MPVLACTNMPHCVLSFYELVETLILSNIWCVDLSSKQCAGYYYTLVTRRQITTTTFDSLK